MEKKWDGIDRRQIGKGHDWFYRVINAGNILVWLVFLAAMVVFHYARPERVSGVERFWGVTGRQEWNEGLTLWLLVLLSICTVSSLVLMLLRRQRNRRKNEGWLTNLVFLGVVSAIWALWLIQIIA